MDRLRRARAGAISAKPCRVERRGGPLVSEASNHRKRSHIGTVAFDPKTADLTIGTDNATSRFGQALNALKREHQRDELVANAILDLLQDAKNRQSAT